MRALNRIPEHDDQLGVWSQRLDPPLRIPVVQVKRRGFALHLTGTRAVEQRLIVIAPPDMLTVGLDVARPAVGGWRSIGQEKLGLLDRRHVQRGVLGQRRMQSRGPSLGDASYEEVR